MTEGEFVDFFRATYPRLVAFGLTMSMPRTVCQELAQETLTRAFRHRDRLTTFDSPYGWCRRVMSNLLIDQHRSRVAERSAVGRLARAAENQHDTPPASQAAETRIAWADLVAPLTPRQRCIAVLYYAEDRSIGDIASDLGVSPGAVKTTLSRVRDSVARHLDVLATDEEMQK